MKTSLPALAALTLSLVAPLAHADGFHRGGPVGMGRGGWGGHERFERYEHAMPRPSYGPRFGVRVGPSGRYEMRAVDRWVPGGWQQQLVPGACDAYGNCGGGGYQQVWVPGHTVRTQEYVWVPYGGGW